MKNAYINTFFKYVHCMRIYKMNTLFSILSGMILLFIQSEVWYALFKQGKQVEATLGEAITYMILSSILLKRIQLYPGHALSKSISNGEIALELNKPISLILFYTAQEAGKAFFRFVVTAIPMFVFSLSFFAFLPPINFTYFVLFLITSVLGLVILVLFDCILGYSSFWVMNNWYIPRIESALFIFFGGTTVPLWFYPQWILNICNVLPFRYITYDVINIYLGRITVSGVLKVIFIQIFWILLLWIFERMIWMKATKKIIIQGG